MRKLIVDGKEIEADDNLTLLQACEQAGAELSHEPRGYVVRTGAGGHVRDGVFAIGEVTGARLDPQGLAREALAMADAADRAR